MYIFLIRKENPKLPCMSVSINDIIILILFDYRSEKIEK